MNNNSLSLTPPLELIDYIPPLPEYNWCPPPDKMVQKKKKGPKKLSKK